MGGFPYYRGENVQQNSRIGVLNTEVILSVESLDREVALHLIFPPFTNLLAEVSTEEEKLTRPMKKPTRIGSNKSPFLEKKVSQCSS